MGDGVVCFDVMDDVKNVLKDDSFELDFYDSVIDGKDVICLDLRDEDESDVRDALKLMKQVMGVKKQQGDDGRFVSEIHSVGHEIKKRID